MVIDEDFVYEYLAASPDGTIEQQVFQKKIKSRMAKSLQTLL
jgi:hypothetical protein